MTSLLYDKAHNETTVGPKMFPLTRSRTSVIFNRVKIVVCSKL